jgi:hypothetical protein
MKSCPLYNGQNLNFTGNQNPYGLIQNGGKRKSKRSRKSMRKRGKGKKTRKYRR